MIGVARGFFEAATTDNVQPLALLACESFGATVAMSPESCHKAFLLCTRSHESAVLAFLKARIGYRTGDSAWQLAQSDAGLRFLGLAACLCTIGSWDAAVILHELIQTTAADKKLVPTSQHLKQLMRALEDRLATSGFAESALGWAILFDHEAKDSDFREYRCRFGDSHCTNTPSTKLIVGLTMAMSRLARIGEEVKRVEVTASVGAAAWLLAFIKWSLGTPPVTVFPDGRTFAPHNDSRVILRITKEPSKAQVDIYDYTDNIKNMVVDTLARTGFVGMVDVRMYGESMLQKYFGSPHDLQYRACVQALPYACVLARKNLVVRNVVSTAKMPNIHMKGSQTSDKTKLTTGQIFPSLNKISHILHDYIGGRPDEAPFILAGLSLPNAIEDLPLVSQVKNWIATVCVCRACQNTSKYIGTRCEFKLFVADIGKVVAHMLAISLFNSTDPKGVRIRFGSKVSDPFTQPFIQSVQSILLNKKPAKCSVSDIIEIACQLVGHEVSNKNAWVMSSRYDQTVFPRLFSSQRLQSEEILCLECIPGFLMWGELRYDTVQFSDLARIGFFDDDDPAPGLVIEPNRWQKTMNDGVSVCPKDLWGSCELKWQVEPKDTTLEVALVMPQLEGLPKRNPRWVLDSAAESVFVDCIHNRMGSVLSSTSNIYTMEPAHPIPKSQDQGSIGIVVCDKNEQVRFFSLGLGRPCIIRQDACLECCMRCCKKLAAPFVVC